MFSDIGSQYALTATLTTSVFRTESLKSDVYGNLLRFL